MLFGAATHDVGKVLQPSELSGPGSAHEPAGHALLLAHGVPERLARIASEADARLAFQGSYPTSG